MANKDVGEWRPSGGRLMGVDCLRYWPGNKTQVPVHSAFQIDMVVIVQMKKSEANQWTLRERNNKTDANTFTWIHKRRTRRRRIKPEDEINLFFIQKHFKQNVKRLLYHYFHVQRIVSRLFRICINCVYFIYRFSSRRVRCASDTVNWIRMEISQIFAHHYKNTYYQQLSTLNVPFRETLGGECNLGNRQLVTT